jgi:hypothetical protein
MSSFIKCFKNMKNNVLQRLKPKVASLGFNEKELDGVAATIAGNLQEDATEEQIDEKIDEILPFLKVSQSFATRVINAEKEKLSKESASPKKHEESDNNQSEDEPAWFKSYREENDRKFAELSEARAKELRRKDFEKKLDGLSQKQKESKLRDFDRIEFKDEDDYASYVAEQEPLIAEIIQEASNNSLGKARRPFSGSSENSDKPTKEELKRVFG